MGKQQTLIQESGANMLESIAAYASAERGPVAVAGTASAKLQGVSRIKNAMEIAIDRITPDPDQPRKSFPESSLEELASSFKEQGQLQPIIVRWAEELGQYKIVVGNRRYLAAGRAGMKTLLCVVMGRDLTPAEVRTVQLIENIHREDLNAIEKAQAFRGLMEEHKCSQRELARILHLDVATVSTTLTLLSLPDDIQGQVLRGAISPTVASEIAKVKDEEGQRELAGRVVTEDLSREEVRKTTRKPRAAKMADRPKHEPSPGTTMTYTFSRGKVSVTVNRTPVRTEDVIALLEETITALRVESPAEEDRPAA